MGRTTRGGRIPVYSIRTGLIKFFIVLLLSVIALVFVDPQTANAKTTIIYPRDKTAVNTATLPIIGVTDTPDEMVRITVNGGGIISRINPDGTFNQAVRLRPGRNILKVDGMRIYVNFFMRGKPPPEGFAVRYVHPPVEEDCTNCHELATAGDYSIMDEGMDLCMNCHDDPVIDSTGKVFNHVHSPIGDDGDCQVCHDPHEGSTHCF